MTLQVTTRRLPTRRFTVDEYSLMAEAGILKEDDRVELIEGEIVQMSPIGRFHVGIVIRLNHLFVTRLGDVAQVSVQNPVHLHEYSEPEPDVALLVPRADFYTSALPTPADVLLLVEVADSSIEFDREVKIPLYARAGIREVWLVDLNAGAVSVFREPSADGYRSIQTLRRGAWASALAFPGREFAVADLLG
ncbi:MAG TPA: Uma2 family endonuclease [Chloroflexota bacterium]|nr:Uma2 family endonuclease [Chloroflexota bacterium]